MKEDVKESLVGVGFGLVLTLLVLLGVISGKTAVFIGLGTIVLSFVLIFVSIVAETLKDR
jgi:hypothetical protein